MKIYDIHSHFGPTSSGEIVSANNMISELKSYGISKVGISCLSGNYTREQNDLIYNTMKEFPNEISNKFQFIQFAVDEDRQGNEVIPGSGGMVYPRLGLGDINKKNQYIPLMVKMRM